jgi:hypothetical protein
MTISPKLLLLILSSSFFCVGTGCASTPDSSFAINGGREDYENRYRATVEVTTPLGSCSGVLIAPSTVLASAHCFCLPQDFKTRAGPHVYTSSACEKQARVTSYRYQREGEQWVEVLDQYKGTIIAHEGFRSEVQDGKVKSHLADLAVIQLEKAMAGVIPEALAELDVTLSERFVIAGFGPSKAKGSDEGVRRFGKNVVTDIITTREAQEFRFSTSGVHILPGDSGGPCFRETSAGRWLVGISGGFAQEGLDSWFTNILYYREWIERQKRS